MSSQDRLENVLRDIHVMISKSEAFDNERIIVSKKDIFELIDRLNASVYDIMDEYELTQQSHERALRENKKEGDKIIWDASRQAEDIYAASVMYTDEALNHLNGIVEQTQDTISKMYKDFTDSMQKQHETIKSNQLELKSQLQLLLDSEKYLNLIEERNKEIAKEKAKKENKPVQQETSTFAAIKPEIKINEDYFRKAGIPIEGEKEEKTQGSEEVMQPLEDEGVIEDSLHKNSDEQTDVNNKQTQPAPQQIKEERQITKNQTGAEMPRAAVGNPEPNAIKQGQSTEKHQEEIQVHLDAEYFNWKNKDHGNKKEPQVIESEPEEKLSLLDKIIGKKK